VNAIAHVALADWQARTRSFSFAIVAALSLELAYLFVPDAHAGYVTVSAHGMRGIYNAQWIGAMSALCSMMILAFAGFYIVRGSVLRDEAAGTGGIVAASPISRFAFIAGKWASNVAILGVVAVVLLIGSLLMQQVRAEDRAFHFAAYALPFLLVVVPSSAIVAASAVFFDTIRALRGTWGSVLWFFIATTLIAIPMTAWIHGDTHPAIDPLGFIPLISSMSEGVRAAASSTNTHALTLGVTIMRVPPQTFAWHGMTWTGLIVVQRLAWLASAVAIVAVASFAFDRFADARSQARRAWRLSFGRLVPDVAGLRLLRAELAVIAGDCGFWWTVTVIGCGVAGAFVPQTALIAGVLPLALLLPLARYGSLGTRDIATGVDALVLSAPQAATRTIAARIIATGIVGCIPLAGALIRYPALAIVPFAAAALSIVIGRLSGTPRAFEALYLAVWYVGALNHVPLADFPAAAISAPATLLATSSVAVMTAAFIARLQLRSA